MLAEGVRPCSRLSSMSWRRERRRGGRRKEGRRKESRRKEGRRKESRRKEGGRKESRRKEGRRKEERILTLVQKCVCEISSSCKAEARPPTPKLAILT